jgi:TolA-binding protein
MSADRRITKKEMKEDKLVTTFFKASEFVQKNPKPFYVGGSAIIIVFLVVMMAVWNSNKKESDSKALLTRANLSIDMGLINEAIADFQLILDDYSGSEVASQACFTMANIYYQQGNYNEALIYFERHYNDYTDDAMMRASSAAGVGACYQFQANYQEAANYYSIAAEIFADPIYAPAYLLKAGQNYAEAGDIENATVSYEKIIESYPESMDAAAAKRALAELRY